VPDIGVLLIRAEATPKSGLGHLMRCLALAQAWTDAGGHVVVCADTARSSFQQLVSTEKFDFREALGIGDEDAVAVAECARETNATWLMLDGYSFSSSYLGNLRKHSKARILFMDDQPTLKRDVDVDVVLNNNIFSKCEDYETSATSFVLAGAKYFLLRKEFQQKRNHPDKIVVTMGGSDLHGSAVHVCRCLFNEVWPLPLEIIVGAMSPSMELIKKMGRECRTNRVEVSIQPEDLANRFASAAVAITAAGVSASEFAALGVPAIHLVLAENQKPVAEAFHKAGAAINLGDHQAVTDKEICGTLRSLLNDKPQMQRMAQQGRSLIDGNGTRRVVSELVTAGCTLKYAEHKDSTFFLESSNEEKMRQVSFRQKKISFSEHQEWFNKQMKSKDALLLVVEYLQHEKIGQIRFEKKRHETIISFGLMPKWRNLGIGSKILASASRFFMNKGWQSDITAYIKCDNPASHRAFLKAGYTEDTELVEISGQRAWRMKYQD